MLNFSSLSPVAQKLVELCKFAHHPWMWSDDQTPVQTRNIVNGIRAIVKSAGVKKSERNKGYVSFVYTLRVSKFAQYYSRQLVAYI